MMNLAKVMGKPETWNARFRQKVERESRTDPFFRSLLEKLDCGKGENH